MLSVKRTRQPFAAFDEPSLRDVTRYGRVTLIAGVSSTRCRDTAVHSASVTSGNIHDSYELPNLLHGEETRLYGDSASRGETQTRRLKELAPKAKDFTNKRAYKNRPLTDADNQTNRRKSAVRSKLQHPFLTHKRIWGVAKVCYRGLAKNANRAFAMLAMLNLVKWGRPLTGEVRLA